MHISTDKDVREQQHATNPKEMRLYSLFLSDKKPFQEKYNKLLTLFLRIFERPIYHKEASMASASTGQFMPPALLANQRCHLEKMITSLQASLLLALLTLFSTRSIFSNFGMAKSHNSTI